MLARKYNTIYMLKHLLHCAALLSAASAPALGSDSKMEQQQAFSPGAQWTDIYGQPIHAHAGHLLLVGGLYHWYGMDSIGCGKDPQCDKPKAAFHAVNVYVSTDLYNWASAGVAINSSLYISRPKVLHNEQTGEFVMWCKATPSAAAFVASSPLGPFNLVYHGDLAGRQVGGLTVYQDVQQPESAWLVYSAKATTTLPRAMMVLPLSSNWSWPKCQVTATYPGHLEGPAVFYSAPERTYYLWTSHTSGWDGSPAVVHCARAMNASIWTLCGPGNPTHNRTAFQSQSTDVIPVPGDTTGRAFIYLADRWVPYVFTEESGRYVWLPLNVAEGGALSVVWENEWAY